jgi:tRNA-Thr(GGU) m(6)t(6)A37 methyltransferase TsaA
MGGMRRTFEVSVIGHVQSPLTDLDQAPLQGDEGAPAAWVVFEPDVRDAWRNIKVGTALTILTFLDRSDRSVLAVHPRGDVRRPVQGVFTTRSPDRPNPIGLHDVRVLDIGDEGILVSDLEAIDGTPVLDVKPVLHSVDIR